MNDDLKILSATVSPPEPVSEEDAERHVRERLHVLIEVKNESAAPLHVWSDRRGYDFDVATGVLSLQLAEPSEELPPGIEMISDHPRAPSQVIIEPGAEATIDVPVPTTVRHRTPGEGMGMSFAEESIDRIRRIEISIQYADVPFQAIIGESPADMRVRLREHGAVARKTVSVRARR